MSLDFKLLFFRLLDFELVFWNFSQFQTVMSLWFYMMAATLAVYPVFHFWAHRRILSKFKGNKTWKKNFLIIFLSLSIKTRNCISWHLSWGWAGGGGVLSMKACLLTVSLSDINFIPMSLWIFCSRFFRKLIFKGNFIPGLY